MHLVVYPPPPRNYQFGKKMKSQFAFGSLPPTPKTTNLVVYPNYQFGNLPPPPHKTTNLVVVTYPNYQFGKKMKSQFVFGNLPPPPKLPRFDQNFLDTGLGLASQRIFLRKTNKKTKKKKKKKQD